LDFALLLESNVNDDASASPSGHYKVSSKLEDLERCTLEFLPYKAQVILPKGVYVATTGASLSSIVSFAKADDLVSYQSLNTCKWCSTPILCHSYDLVHYNSRPAASRLSSHSSFCTNGQLRQANLCRLIMHARAGSQLLRPILFLSQKFDPAGDVFLSIEEASFLRLRALFVGVMKGVLEPVTAVR